MNGGGEFDWWTASTPVAQKVPKVALKNSIEPTSELVYDRFCYRTSLLEKTSKQSEEGSHNAKSVAQTGRHGHFVHSSLVAQK